MEPTGLDWEPLNLFRMSPTFQANSLALVVGITLAGFTAAAVLGIRGTSPKKTSWHGLILVTLAGCLVLVLAANLLTLALGSGLIDLALIGMAIYSRDTGEQAQRVAWRMAVPGILSTLVLFAGAAWMDAQTGTASLLARQVPLEVLTLMCVSGLLRLMIFPLHPRGLKQGEQIATHILPFGAGAYLLARAQAIDPSLAGQPWIWIVGGVALLAGGWMLWVGPMRSVHHEQGAARMGIVANQTGLALTFLLLSTTGMPWPLISLPLALGLLAIWWDSGSERPAASRPTWLAGLDRWFTPRRPRVNSWIARRVPALRSTASAVVWWQGTWLARRGPALLPALALASLAGVPFTAGAMTRWRMYGGLMQERRATLLLALLVADSLLVAGLWAASKSVLKQADAKRPQAAALLAMLALAVLLVLIGILPQKLAGGLGLPAQAAKVSVWGLGLIYVLPWLVGSWLARVTGPTKRLLAPVLRLTSLDRVFRATARAGQWLVDAVYWVGSVGEGEGWWAWALIILAVGTLFLAAR